MSNIIHTQNNNELFISTPPPQVNQDNNNIGVQNKYVNDGNLVTKACKSIKNFIIRVVKLCVNFILFPFKKCYSYIKERQNNNKENNFSTHKAEKEVSVNDSNSTLQDSIVAANLEKEQHLENTEDSTPETNTSIVFKAEKEEPVNDSVVDSFIKESKNRYKSIEFINNYTAVLRDKKGSIIIAGVCKYPTISTTTENYFRKQLALYLSYSDNIYRTLSI